MRAEHEYCAELQTQDKADVSFMMWINTGWDNTIKLLIYTQLYKGLVRCAAALFGTALSMRANHVTKRTVTLMFTVGFSDVAELNECVIIIIIITIIIIIIIIIITTIIIHFP
jgi:hypothetical protein